MITLGNRDITLFMEEDGSAVSLYERGFDSEWRMEPMTLGYRRPHSAATPEVLAGDLALKRVPLADGQTERQDDAITVTYTLPDGEIRYTWRLVAGHVEVTLDVAGADVEFVSLPGALVPSAGECELALPLYQGVAMRDAEGTWEHTLSPAGHCGPSLGMCAARGDLGSLVAVQDGLSNWALTYGARSGRLYAFFEARRCPVDGWESQVVCLYPHARSLTRICELYRDHLSQNGDLVTWPEKLEQKPILQELFGAAMVFTGYNKADDVDYVASAERLAEMGFDRALFYPTRMCHYSLGFDMGGDAPVWLSDAELHGVRAVPGYHTAPWTWTYEALDDGTPERRAIYRHGVDNQPVPNWRMDGRKWYRVCTPYQAEYIRERLAGDMEEMAWLHFDVNGCIPGEPCFRTDHALHDGHLGRRGDLLATRDLFSHRTVGNRIVSSEGFHHHYASVLDIGTCKLLPGADASRITPVPLTMLVLHDSCVHDWWELQSYNNLAGWPVHDAPLGLGSVGSGMPRLKAAMDALYGCPPNVFAFGRQYAWLDIESRETYAFTVQIDDPDVQEALHVALPVAKHFRRIGMEPMVSFRFESDDRMVQSSRFGDGTRVVANLSDVDHEVEGIGTMAAHSWRSLDD